MVEIGEITDAVPEDVKAEALALKDAMAAGDTRSPARQPPGRQRMARRGRGRDDGTLGMDFYVEG